MANQLDLGDIAEIRSGYSFRGAVKDMGSGSAVVQARDIGGMYANNAKLPLVQGVPPTSLLAEGDVLLTARGSFRASVAKFGQPTVASSSLFVLRLKVNEVSPEFLALYLNSSKAQSHLKQNARGGSIQSITVNDLKSLRVPSVPAAHQHLLVELQQNVERQSDLLKNKLNIIEEIYTKAVIRGAA